MSFRLPFHRYQSRPLRYHVKTYVPSHQRHRSLIHLSSNDVLHNSIPGYTEDPHVRWSRLSPPPKRRAIRRAHTIPSNLSLLLRKHLPIDRKAIIP
jgi:hypothetical protein